MTKQHILDSLIEWLQSGSHDEDDHNPELIAYLMSVRDDAPPPSITSLIEWLEGTEDKEPEDRELIAWLKAKRDKETENA